MPSRAACFVVAGAGAYAASTAFTSAVGAPALRAAPVASAADLRAEGAAEAPSQMPTAALALGAVAAAGAAAQSGKRGARRTALRAVGTMERPTMQDVEKAKADYEMKKWAADKLASEGAPQAAMVAQNAAAAEAKWKELEAAATGNAPAPTSYAPPAAAAAAPAPVPAPAPTPVAAAAAGTPNRALMDEVKKAKADYEMKKWAADKLASEGAPQAAMVVQNAAAAEAKWKALEEQLAGAAPAAPVYAPPAAAPAAVAAPAGAVSEQEVKKAKDDFELKKWAADRLAAQGAPQAAMVAQYAATAEALWKSLEEKLTGAAPATPAYTAPVVASAPAPAAGGGAVAAYAASLPDAASADLEKAKEQADLLTWAYEKLASQGAPQAAMMKGKADQAVATYNALLAQSK